jgi:UrcA family protein
MTRTLIAALAALASTATSANASAIRIHGDQAFIAYQDLNLSSHHGRNALVGRIKAAADRVCNPEEFNSFSHADKACFRLAVSSGIEQMEMILPASARS